MALAILSILSMISIPLYFDYRTRIKVGTEFVLMEPVKKRLLEEFMINGQWPQSNADAHLYSKDAYAGDYLLSVEVSDEPRPGSIILTYDTEKLPALGSNNTIIFYPDVALNNQSVGWLCDLGNLQADFRPRECR